jgi:hypothetical protein
MRARWQELNGDRSGELVMRTQHLTREMLSVLKLEETRIRLRILSDPAEVPDRLDPLSVNEFSYAKVTIDSRSSKSTF